MSRKLKIVFLGNFRVSYSTESHHCWTLKEDLGHEVITLQESEVSSEAVVKKCIGADLFIWVHTHGWDTSGNLSGSEMLRIIKAMGVTTISYHLDLWFGLKRQKDLRKDTIYKEIDYFVTVDREMAKWFNEKTKVKGIYLPAGVVRNECILKSRRQKNEVIFVGSRNYHHEWPYRNVLISHLEKTYESSFQHYGNGGKQNVRGAKLNSLYQSTKVVVGDSLCPKFSYPDYWSDRVYETLGRGGFLIHPKVAGMEREFEDGKHLKFYEYGDFEFLDYLIGYYLNNSSERERIRRQGHEHVKKNLTYTNRWISILKSIDL